jgi:hypothetical protein
MAYVVHEIEPAMGVGPFFYSPETLGVLLNWQN